MQAIQIIQAIRAIQLDLMSTYIISDVRLSRSETGTSGSCSGSSSGSGSGSSSCIGSFSGINSGICLQ